MAESRAFDLHALVRDIADSGLLGPREIAAKVAENVPGSRLREALALALVPYVREFLTRARQPVVVSPQKARNVNSARSAKVQAIREGWRRVVSGQFHVGNGQWQVLADCSYEQVMFLVAERQEQARRNAAAAEMFERLADVMKRRKVARVGDLPESVLADILTIEDAA